MSDLGSSDGFLRHPFSLYAAEKAEAKLVRFFFGVGRRGCWKAIAAMRRRDASKAHENVVSAQNVEDSTDGDGKEENMHLSCFILSHTSQRRQQPERALLPGL